MPDHMRICLSMPPKFGVSLTLGVLRGKSAVRIHRELLRERRVTWLSCCAMGYCVSTVGLGEKTIEKYIR